MAWVSPWFFFCVLSRTVEFDTFYLSAISRVLIRRFASMNASFMSSSPSTGLPERCILHTSTASSNYYFFVWHLHKSRRIYNIYTVCVVECSSIFLYNCLSVYDAHSSTKTQRKICYFHWTVIYPLVVCVCVCFKARDSRKQVLVM